MVFKPASNSNSFISQVISDPKELGSAYRIRRSRYDEKSVHTVDVDDYINKGWELQRTGKYKSRIKRIKSHNSWLEDRLWCLLYNMGYRKLNGANFKIEFTRDDGSSGTKQIDVYAEDDDTVLIVECKSRESEGKSSLQKHIEETHSLQPYIRKSVLKRYPNDQKPKLIWVYATNNILWSKQDMARAEAYSIKRITDNELYYYEIFIRHMGPAGRYQILGEFLREQKIPGLADVKLPAIRGKIGGEVFYSFVVTPRHLLKIAFVNHQALSHPDGKPAYQRMINSSRIKEISDYIEKGGYFPTNILVNFTVTPRFDHISNKENTDPNIKFGWITLPNIYRSAWIIDGQHRLYGFSYLDNKHLDQSLFVLAFVKLPPKKEAEMFITINNKQKSVPRGLLLGLLPDLKMDDDDPNTELSALSSTIQRELNQDPDSPFFKRFTVPDMPAESSQSLTVAEFVKGLRVSGLIGKVTGKSLTPGPFTGIDEGDTIDRALKVLNTYFEWIRDAHEVRWGKGREAYICTNPGIRAHLMIIANTITYLSHKQSVTFPTLKAEEIADRIIESCEPIFVYIENANDDEIEEKFARKFGDGGVRTYSFQLMDIMSDSHSDFGSDDYKLWKDQQQSDQIEDVNRFLMKFSERLTNYVIDTLKEVHGTERQPSGEERFWEVGVENQKVREKAFNKQQDDDPSRRKQKEAYLDIVDIEIIVKQKNNWEHFSDVLSNARKDERKGQKYYLGWIAQYNELRKIAAHPNQYRTYSKDDLDFVDWLKTEVSSKIPE